MGFSFPSIRSAAWGVVLALVLCSCAGGPDVPVAEIDAVFAQWDRPDSPGAALAVVRDGEIVYSRGYGMANLEHGVPITPETVFYIGSTSKQFVAAAIHLLAEEGKLSLDDDIRTYVPEIPTYDRTITIRHLLHHTSGLRDYLTLWSLSGRNFADSMSEEEILDLLSRQQALNFPPGDQYMYSNSGYFLLAVIVKRVSGLSLREFAEENIFSPLGMANTHFHDDRNMIVRNRAQGHLIREDSTFALYTSSFDLVGSGGLHTTVEDLARWDRNFYHNRLGKSDQGLIDSMAVCGVLNGGDTLTYASGLRVDRYRGLNMVSHGGSFIGFKAELLRFPEQGFSVICLCNLSEMNPVALARSVADICLADLLKQEEEKEEEPPSEAEESETPPFAPESLAAYVGTYHSSELLTTYRLTVKEGQIKLRPRYEPALALEPEAPDKFKAGAWNLTFNKDRNGTVSGFVLDAGRVKNIAFARHQAAGERLTPR